MNVVSPVAVVAVVRQRDLGDVLGRMTGVTLQALMRSRQRIPGLCRMVEAPARPSIRVVAQGAISAQPPLVMPVPVTTRANPRRVLERRRAMTFLARHDGMAADQRKARNVMIEADLLPPAGLAMTAFAAGSELAFMRIILLVAGHAGRRELVAIEIARMAPVTLDLYVPAAQRKLGGLVVIEAHRLPLV